MAHPSRLSVRVAVTIPSFCVIVKVSPFLSPLSQTFSSTNVGHIYPFGILTDFGLPSGDLPIMAKMQPAKSNIHVELCL